MIRALDDLIERRIEEALREGEFANLPGAGKPLVIEDEPLVPEEVRAAYRVLKNAGLVPPELERLRRERTGGSHPSTAGARLDQGPTASSAREQALVIALERRGVNLSHPGLSRYAARIRQRLAAHGDQASPAQPEPPRPRR